MNLLPAGLAQESSAVWEEPVLVEPCLCCHPELLPGANYPLNRTQVCLSKGARVSRERQHMGNNVQMTEGPTLMSK